MRFSERVRDRKVPADRMVVGRSGIYFKTAGLNFTWTLTSLT
jgi:hypothetical protein